MTLSTYHHMGKITEFNGSVRNIYATPRLPFHTASDVKTSKNFIKPKWIIPETAPESLGSMKVFIKGRSLILEPVERIENLKSKNVSYDDREKIWRLLFGNKPMPSIESNTVERFCFILDREIKKSVNEYDLRRIFHRARNKYAK